MSLKELTVFYGGVCLVSDFKLPWGNDDLLSLRHRKNLKYHTLCTSTLKCRFPTKVIKLTWVILVKVLGVLQL